MSTSAHQSGIFQFSELCFPSSLMVWALRRSIQTPQDRHSLDQTFNRVFAAAGCELAKTAMVRLVQSLRDSVKTELEIRQPWVTDVSCHEATILAIISAFQVGSADRALGLVKCLVDEREQSTLADSAASLAFALASAGYRLPPDGIGRDFDHPTVAPATAVQKRSALGGPVWLTVNEAVIVSGIRVWVQSLKQDGAPYQALHLYFEQQGIVDAADSLHTILDHTGLSATRTLSVHCPSCPGLSVDEARVISAVAAMQWGDRLTAMTELSSWLPNQVIRLTICAVEGLAITLATANAMLPQRDWNFQTDRRSDVTPDLKDYSKPDQPDHRTIH